MCFLKKKTTRKHPVRYSSVSVKQKEVFVHMMSDSDRIRGNCFKLKEGRFRLDTGRQVFTQRAVRHWHSCPESCGAPSLEVQGQVGWGPGQPELVGDSPAAWGWNCVGYKVPSSLGHSAVL